jgi:hypothetical protein
MSEYINCPIFGFRTSVDVCNAKLKSKSNRKCFKRKDRRYVCPILREIEISEKRKPKK